MGTGRHKLTATGLKAAAPGTHQDGAGLMLLKAEAGGSWVWRFSQAGRRRDMGLGRWPDLSLAEARKARDRWAAVLAQGLDPVAERERLREQDRAERSRTDPTLEQAVAEVLKAIAPTLRDGGARGRWASPLERHVLPRLGSRRLSTIGQEDVQAALAPIWRANAPTAQKAMQRLGIVFRRGRRMGWPCDPFVLEAARELLGEVRHVPKPIAATPWRKVPEVYAKLDSGSSAHLALRMMILTAVRSSGVRGLRFEEVDGDVWTVPAVRMKAREGKADDFRVPLAPAALEIVEDAREFMDGALAFAGSSGNPVTDVGIQQSLNDLGEAGRPHGFRSSFRSWAQDNPALCSWEVAETALAHRVGGTVERSYARSDLLDQRRETMTLWASFVTTPPAP